MLELYRGLREAGVMVGVGRLRSVESATSVRVRGGETEIVDGPFAVTKERLAGYYIMDCADLDEALKSAARMLGACHGTIEVCPVLSADEWVDRARDAGADVPGEAVRYLT
ncbi:MAG: YciI family protein [Solirubrobacteraceae bacterium]